MSSSSLPTGLQAAGAPKSPPATLGIVETALYVRDVAVAATFYQRLFAFETLLASDRLHALGVGGRDVLLLFKEGATSEPFATSRGTIPGHAGSGPTHFAFAIPLADVDTWRAWLTAQGVAVESEVTWEGEARSLYFRDPDHNLVELITPGFWRVSF